MSNEALLMIKIMPTAMIVLSLLSAFIYLYYGDYKYFTYWMAAAALNYSITYM